MAVIGPTKLRKSEPVNVPKTQDQEIRSNWITCVEVYDLCRNLLVPKFIKFFKICAEVLMPKFIRAEVRLSGWILEIAHRRISGQMMAYACD